MNIYLACFSAAILAGLIFGIIQLRNGKPGPWIKAEYPCHHFQGQVVWIREGGDFDCPECKKKEKESKNA